MTSKTNNSTKQLKPLFLKVSTNIDRKSNPVPSSLIFLSFLKHFSSIFFFLYIYIQHRKRLEHQLFGSSKRWSSNFSYSGFVWGSFQEELQWVGWVVFPPHPPEEQKKTQTSRCFQMKSSHKLLSLLARKRTTVHLSSFLDTLDECHAVDLRTQTLPSDTQHSSIETDRSCNQITECLATVLFASL